MLTQAQIKKLDTLHARAVKATQQWQAATPGTVMERKRFHACQRAEDNFTSYLCKLAK